MKKVVLIQNQTEMANYGHADCRAALTRLGHDYTLLTADTIGTLDDLTGAGQVDCLIIGSNSLHDGVIRNYLSGIEGQKSIERIAESGAGLLIMMQYKAAYDGYDLPLPKDLGEVKGVPRPDKETAIDSLVIATANQISPPLLSYPNNVLTAALEEAGRNHQSLAGVYWHYWALDDISRWDTIISCHLSSSDRPLIVSSKEHIGKRVILSAIPVDWQGQDDIFDNLITYAADGRHSTAFINASSSNDTTSKYLSAKLISKGTAHRVYGNTETERERAANNAIYGIHNTLYLSNGGPLSEYFSDTTTQSLQESIRSGSLRIVALERSINSYHVEISGQRSAARDAYELLIPAIAEALSAGFLDGSFRGTVSGLQELERLPYGLDSTLFPLARVMSECQRRDRNGSYDEVIGATAALLWLRGKVWGVHNQSTASTLAWLRPRFPLTDARERLHSLGVLHALGILDQTEIELANSTLTTIDFERSTEIELISFLEASVRFERPQTTKQIVHELARRQASGAGPVWIDIPTTASLISILVSARDYYARISPDMEQAKRELLEIVIPSMVAIEESYHRSFHRITAGSAFPWDGKASTALRCLAAWYLFDQWLSAPVEEAAEAIIQSSRRGALNTLAEGAVNSLRSTFDRYVAVQEVLDRQTTTLQEALGTQAHVSTLQVDLKKALRRARELLISLIVLLYIVADHVVRTRFMGEKLNFGDSLLKHYSDHAAVATFLVAVFAVPWDKVGSAIDAKIRDWRSGE